MLLRLAVAVLAVGLIGLRPAAAVTPTPLGQPSLSGTSLATRCADPDARFNFTNDGGFAMYGPAGIAVDPRGRVFVTDYGGRRVLTWPNINALSSCSKADGVIGVGDLAGPESVAVDTRTGAVFVADTLSHTVLGYRKTTGTWKRFVILGQTGVSGDDFAHFNFPRGIALDPRGRLFVADDFNNRVLIFNQPFTSGQAAADSIYAGSDGGFSGPKAVAMSGDTLFVADYDNGRVLRFTGPFRTPDKTYVSTGVFAGVGSPVDLAVGPDGSLFVTDQHTPHVAVYKDAVFRTGAAKPDSTFAEALGPEPLGVAADREGRVYVADYRRYRVLIRPTLNLRAPVTAGATNAAKALIANLRSRPSRAVDRTAIGQQLITWEYGAKTDPDAWYGDWLQMEKAGLPLPQIMGGELSDLETYAGFQPNQAALDELVRHGKAGHIVTLVWHPDNPTGGAFGKPITNAQLRQMVNRATPVGKAWQTQLDRAAAVLKVFADAGVPVLFRPLHEQNGDFFWWGSNHLAGRALRGRQAAWVAVWRDMVKEMTQRKGLKNLVFVFGTNQVDWSGIAPPMTFYPGARFADVVAIDVYDERLDMAGAARGTQHYAALVGTGKPVGMAEFGQSYGDNGTGADGAAWDARTLATRIRDSYPRLAFAIAWYSSVEGKPPVPYVFALPDVSHTKELLADPLIETQ